jgi:hypothetical protein
MGRQTECNAMSFGKRANPPQLKPLNLVLETRKAGKPVKMAVETAPRMKSSFTSVYQFSDSLAKPEVRSDDRLYQASLWVLTTLILGLAAYMLNPAWFESLPFWPFK